MKGKTAWGIGIAIGLVIVVILLLIPRQEIEFDCSVGQIEYVRLENATCWNRKFSDNYCPLPTNLQCSGRATYSLMQLLVIL